MYQCKVVIQRLKEQKNTRIRKFLKHFLCLRNNFDTELKRNERQITKSVAAHIEEFLTFNYKSIQAPSLT